MELESGEGLMRQYRGVIEASCVRDGLEKAASVVVLSCSFIFFITTRTRSGV